ncbi:TPA: hypothetical protein ACPEZC_004691, partial [Klebsiella pneumoniae]
AYPLRIRLTTPFLRCPAGSGTEYQSLPGRVLLFSQYPCMHRASLNLARMVGIACQQLQNKLWVECLVVEYSETIDLQQQGKAVENMSNIKQQGVASFSTTASHIAA